jgi:SpoVK/Ycf46/Vps4 family AAA+-type ATPase
MSDISCQYIRNNNSFYTAGASYPSLPAGVYEAKRSMRGLYFDKREVVTDDLLRLPDSTSELVISEIRRFWQLKDRFADLGFLHKRGILLYGPPGSGKTSTVMFLTKNMIDDGGVVFLAGSDPDDLSDGLAEFRQVEPDRNVVVILEDLDCLISGYDDEEEKFLSILDGEKSITNVVYLATTNYPEKLGKRIINRPSRFDRVVKISAPSAAARLSYLKERRLGLSEMELMTWVEKTNGLTVAHLKELIVSVACFGNDLDEQIQRLREMSETPTSADDED